MHLLPLNYPVSLRDRKTLYSSKYLTNQFELQRNPVPAAQCQLCLTDAIEHAHSSLNKLLIPGSMQAVRDDAVKIAKSRVKQDFSKI